MAQKAKYQMFDALPAELYEQLEDDIKARGVLVPVELDQDGNILDGHNRVEIAEKHGKPWRDKAITRSFETEEQKFEHIIKLNLCRRQLSDVQWGHAFIRFCEQRGVPLGSGQHGKTRFTPSAKRQSPERANVALSGATLASVAAECGVSERTAKRRMAAARKCETRGDAMKKAMAPKKKTTSKDVRKTKANEDGAVWQRVTVNLKSAWPNVGAKQQITFLRWLWNKLKESERTDFLAWARKSNRR